MLPIPYTYISNSWLTYKFGTITIRSMFRGLANHAAVVLPHIFTFHGLVNHVAVLYFYISWTYQPCSCRTSHISTFRGLINHTPVEPPHISTFRELISHAIVRPPYISTFRELINYATVGPPHISTALMQLGYIYQIMIIWMSMCQYITRSLANLGLHLG